LINGQRCGTGCSTGSRERVRGEMERD